MPINVVNYLARRRGEGVGMPPHSHDRRGRYPTQHFDFRHQ
jgi:hypothetical protein